MVISFFFKLIDTCIHFCHVSSLFYKYMTFLDPGSTWHHPPFLKRARWIISPSISSEGKVYFLFQFRYPRIKFTFSSFCKIFHTEATDLVPLPLMPLMHSHNPTTGTKICLFQLCSNFLQ